MSTERDIRLEIERRMRKSGALNGLSERGVIDELVRLELRVRALAAVVYNHGCVPTHVPLDAQTREEYREEIESDRQIVLVLQSGSELPEMKT